MNREQEIQLQFLDEAQDYIKALEVSLIGLSNGIDSEKIHAALRAAHSIKGGAGMMGFSTLSDLAHRLEDSLKVLKIKRQSVEVDRELEELLLTAIAYLQQIIELEQQRQPLDSDWLTAHILPIFVALHERLGEPQEEDAFSILSPEEGQEIIPLLFRTEIDESLTQIETMLATSDPATAETLACLVEELGGVGEMLQLPAFTQLCASIGQHLAAAPDQFAAIGPIAVQAWRRSQALVLTNHLEALPNQIRVDGVTLSAESVPYQDEPDRDLLDLEVISTWPDLDAVAEAMTLDTHDLEADPILPNQPEPVGSQSLVSLPNQAAYPALDSPSMEPGAEAKFNPPIADSSENTIRVPVKQLDRLNDLFGELTIERNGLNLNVKRLRTLLRTLTQRIKVLEQSNTELRDLYDKTSAKANTATSASPDLTEPFSTSRLSLGGSSVSEAFHSPELNTRFDALEFDRYDQVHLLSQEVMETIVQIQEVTGDLDLGLDEAEQTTRELNKTARQMQNNLNQVRMRPLADLTDRFSRALRELALQYGKPVQFEVEGENTLIDRNILESLSEPLLHLVRNAFDHGIESPEVRQAWNKPGHGLIRLQSFHQNDRTVIQLSDDGGGIPIDKVRTRARQMGLDEMLLAAASDEELLSLIFEPGFSTSDQVTALSGRGMGMDIVRERLRQIQGEIRIATQAGVGTTFTLSVPLTLSVMRVLIAESNGLPLALPTSAVQEMIVLKPEQIITTAGSEAFTWNGIMVQLVRLRQWLTFNCPRPLENTESNATVQVPTVLLLQQGNQWVGLEVDRCWGEQEVTIRQVKGGPALPAGFSNCIIIGDGRVVPLTDTADLLRWITSCQRSQSPDLQSASLPLPLSLAATDPLHTVLIVDDSINVRRFLALTLEKAGYRVIQAKDGQEALDKLAIHLNVQAVVCDIEMPRLDGYGFLAQLRSNPTYEQLPVAMLTTRSSDKHRQLALSLGATAYFSKPFNEQMLLHTLEQMVAA